MKILPIVKPGSLAKLSAVKRLMRGDQAEFQRQDDLKQFENEKLSVRPQSEGSTTARKFFKETTPFSICNFPRKSDTRGRLRQKRTALISQLIR